MENPNSIAALPLSRTRRGSRWWWRILLAAIPVAFAAAWWLPESGWSPGIALTNDPKAGCLQATSHYIAIGYPSVVAFERAERERAAHWAPDPGSAVAVMEYPWISVAWAIADARTCGYFFYEGSGMLAGWFVAAITSMFVLPLLLSLWSLWRPRGKRSNFECVDCGYDLTGNVGGRCPECGNACEMSRRTG